MRPLCKTLVSQADWDMSSNVLRASGCGDSRAELSHADRDMSSNVSPATGQLDVGTAVQSSHRQTGTCLVTCYVQLGVGTALGTAVRSGGALTAWVLHNHTIMCYNIHVYSTLQILT